MCVIWFDEKLNQLGKGAARAAYFEALWRAAYDRLVSTGTIPDWK